MDLVFTLNEIDTITRQFISLYGDKKIVAVNGEMGAGKTTFIHAVCRQMGITDKMSSPTYPIIQQYVTCDNKIVNHIDVYRLKDMDEAIQAGVQDALNSGDFCFVEWPEKILNILPLPFLNVHITAVTPTHRRLIINK